MDTEIRVPYTYEDPIRSKARQGRDYLKWAADHEVEVEPELRKIIEKWQEDEAELEA